MSQKRLTTPDGTGSTAREAPGIPVGSMVHRAAADLDDIIGVPVDLPITNVSIGGASMFGACRGCSAQQPRLYICANEGQASSLCHLREEEHEGACLLLEGHMGHRSRLGVCNSRQARPAAWTSAQLCMSFPESLLTSPAVFCFRGDQADVRQEAPARSSSSASLATCGDAAPPPSPVADITKRSPSARRYALLHIPG